MRCGERPGPALQLQLAGRSADRCPPAEMGGSVSDIPRGERNHRLSWKPVGTERVDVNCDVVTCWALVKTPATEGAAARSLRLLTLTGGVFELPPENT